jgi:transposase
VIDIQAIKSRFEALAPHLNERARRLFAASEAQTAGRGGIAAVAEVTGIARSTIGRGLAELRTPEGASSRRIRRPGGGRKSKVETEPGLLDALGELVQSAIRGDPEAALLWVSKSQRHLAAALAERGFTASQKLVGRLLRRLGFSLQANRKTREGSSPPDRNAQFEHINAQINAFQAAGQPTISVDTKKKELVETSRMAVVNCARRVILNLSGCMISCCPNWARWRHTVSMTWPPMPAGSISASPVTRPPLRWKASGAGGANSDRLATRTPSKF